MHRTPFCAAQVMLVFLFISATCLAAAISEEPKPFAVIAAPRSELWTNEGRWKDVEIEGKKAVQLVSGTSYPWLKVDGEVPQDGQVVMALEYYTTGAGFAAGIGAWGSHTEVVSAQPAGWHTARIVFQADVIPAHMQDGVIHALIQGGGANGPSFSRISLRAPKKGEVLDLFRQFVKEGTAAAWEASKKPPFVHVTDKYDPKAEVNPSDEDKKRGAIPFARSYLRFIFPSTVPDPKERGTKGGVVLTPGEYEPLQFAIHALKDFNALQAEVSGKAPEGVSIAIHWVECAPKRHGGSRSKKFRIRPNRLWPKDIFPTCAVKQGESQAWWLIVKTADNLKAGAYPVRVSVKDGDAEVAAFDVEVRVLPFSLPTKMDIGFFLCESNRVEEEAIIVDLGAHGQNGMSAWSDFQPVSGGKVIFTVWDAYFATLKKYGLDHTFFWYLGNSKSGNSVLDSVGMEKFVELLKGINARVKDGRYPKLFALTVDEAVQGKEAFNDFKQLVQLVKEHAPELKLQGTSLDEHSLALRYQGLIDVLACNGSIPQNSAWCKAQKIIFTTYGSVSAGFDARHTRFNYGFYPWQYDAKGINGWAMRWNNGHPYNDMDGDITDWGIFLPSWLGTPITTPSWEGFREGVDDQRYLQVYEELVKAGKAAGALLKELKENGVGKMTELREKVVGDSEFGAVMQNAEDLEIARGRVIQEILKALGKK